MATIPRHKRIEGGLLGLLVGDALGVPYEFHPPHKIPPVEQIELVPPPGFRRAHAGVPPGTWDCWRTGWRAGHPRALAQAATRRGTPGPTA